MKKVICDHAGECKNIPLASKCLHRKKHKPCCSNGMNKCGLDLCTVIDEWVECVEAPDE